MSKRKAYRPRPPNPAAVQVAMMGCTVLSRADQDRFTGSARTALNNLRFGNNCEHAWRALADTFNVAEALAINGICSDAESHRAFSMAQDALSEVLKQHNESRSWTLRAWQIVAFEEAIDRHAIQLRFCSMREYAKALEQVRERVRQALAGNASAGTAVLSINK